jgi:hypothetical protein
VVETTLATLLVGLSIGIVWLPVGFWMGVASVRKIAEADHADEVPDFLQEAARSRKENDMALSAKEVDQQYNNDD